MYIAWACFRNVMAAPFLVRKRYLDQSCRFLRLCWYRETLLLGFRGVLVAYVLADSPIIFHRQLTLTRSSGILITGELYLDYCLDT